MGRLTKMQTNRLRTIAGYRPTERWPHAAFWKDSRTDQSLVRRGLVERIDHETILGGRGTVGHLKVTWHLCKLTPAGRSALEASDEQ